MHMTATLGVEQLEQRQLLSTYIIKPLGQAVAVDIGARGQVAGWHGNVGDFWTRPGNHTVIAGPGVATNDHNDMVGRLSDINGGGPDKGYFWNPSYGSNEFAPIAMTPYAINNPGTIAGRKVFTEWGSGPRATLLTGETYSDLGTLIGNCVGCYSAAFGISDTGTVVGWSDAIYGQVSRQAFRYQSGIMEQLSGTSGWDTVARAVSNTGWIAGFTANGWYDPDSYDPAGSDTHAWIVAPGEDTGIDIGTLPGDDASQAFSINRTGVAVGSSVNSSLPTGPVRRAFVYADGAMTDLNMLIPANSGYKLTSAVGVNDKGWIAVNSYKGANPFDVWALMLIPAGSAPSAPGFNPAILVTAFPLNQKSDS
jgi:probable HAF family extracellular repeat protein